MTPQSIDQAYQYTENDTQEQQEHLDTNRDTMTAPDSVLPNNPHPMVALGLGQYLCGFKTKNYCFLATPYMYMYPEPRHKTTEKEYVIKYGSSSMSRGKSFPHIKSLPSTNPPLKPSHTSQQTPPKQHPPPSDAKSSKSAVPPQQPSTAHQDY
jgi:hypothetical protein